MSRRPIVAGNWKMNLTATEAAELAAGLVSTLGGFCEGRDVVVCPPFTSLASVQTVIEKSSIELGAQNLHAHDCGAFTGEISPGMILTSGCTYVILGHSERRHLFGELDKDVNAKLVKALAAGLNPIVCIGETLDQRDAGNTETVVLGQVGAAIARGGTRGSRSCCFGLRAGVGDRNRKDRHRGSSFRGSWADSGIFSAKPLGQMFRRMFESNMVAASNRKTHQSYLHAPISMVD